MSSAPLEVMDPNEAQKTAANQEAAVEAGALPPPSTSTVTCAAGKDYLKKNGVDEHNDGIGSRQHVVWR